MINHRRTLNRRLMLGGSLASLLGLGGLAGCAAQAGRERLAVDTPVPGDPMARLPPRFDPERFTRRLVGPVGRQIPVRVYENLPVVARPLEPTWQVINLYIPEAYFSPGGRVGRYGPRSAPIFLPNAVGGYMPAKPAGLDGPAGRPPGAGAAASAGRPGGAVGPGGQGDAYGPDGPGGVAPPPGGMPPPGGPGGFGGPGGPGGAGEGRAPADGAPPADPGGANAVVAALLRGFVVAAPGARGRTLRGADGRWTGKAPAAIVDLKAAVRWLRAQGSQLPGNTERIISNGTSAGGALSALLGASANQADYEPELQALGAAPGRDDVFAVSAYCPITNLEHADAAYEWQFQGVAGTRPVEPALSGELQAQFIRYANGLALPGPDGQPLLLGADGHGPLREHIAALVLASARQAQQAGQSLADRPWLRLQGGQPTGIDFDAYLRAIGRMKGLPAFDGLGLETPENQLFGDAATDRRHFTAWAQAHSRVSGAALADDRSVRLMSAMAWALAPQAQPARHWRIRHGTRDRDTALAVPVLLAAALRQRVADVDLALPWDQPHGGDYDLPELFDWIEQRVALG